VPGYWPMDQKRRFRPPRLPDGQISKTCQAPFAKIFWFSEYPNQGYIFRHPVPKEGRFAVVTNVGCGMRWTLRQRWRTLPKRTEEVVWS
jgi:hypothetical protein